MRSSQASSRHRGHQPKRRHCGWEPHYWVGQEHRAPPGVLAIFEFVNLSLTPWHICPPLLNVALIIPWMWNVQGSQTECSRAKVTVSYKLLPPWPPSAQTPGTKQLFPSPGSLGIGSSGVHVHVCEWEPQVPGQSIAKRQQGPHTRWRHLRGISHPAGRKTGRQEIVLRADASQ